jgi:hypothetical protein
VSVTTSGSVLESTSGPGQAFRVDSCPIEPHAEQNFVVCEFAQGGGGQALLTIEEFAGDVAATIWERPGSGDWQPVLSQTWGESEPGATVQDGDGFSSEWVNLDDVVVFDVGLGGSGGFRAFEVYGWPAGAVGVQRLGVVSARPAAGMLAPAGRLVLTANHWADSDPTCCPTQREVMVFDRPTSSPLAATDVVLQRRAELPVEVAAVVYDAWVHDRLGSVSGQLGGSASADLSGRGSPGEDVYRLPDRRCTLSGSTGASCVLEDAGGSSATMTMQLQDTGGGDWRVQSVTFS